MQYVDGNGAHAGFVPERRASGLGWIRRALWGLTPPVIALVASLMFLRVLGLALPGVRAAFEQDALGAWTSGLWHGYLGLVKMAVPMLLIVIATANLGPQRGWQRVAALAAAIVISAGIGTQLRLVGWDEGWSPKMQMMAYVWPRYALLGALLTFVGELYRRELAANRAARNVELDRMALDKAVNEAQLQVLKAQIEPHFLFNTLANVRRLYAEDAAAGRLMLESLMRYLEVALPKMRSSDSTLGRDAELIEAYLQIQQIRMGHRLRFEIDVPPDLRATRIPPMMLLTLVENAVKHGLGASTEGGTVTVLARAAADRLILTVADTGVGFKSGWGAGIGLANLSSRLAAEFGEHASLELSNNASGGASVSVVLPLPGPDECVDIGEPCPEPVCRASV